MPAEDLPRLAVFISGGGGLMRRVVRACQAGELAARVDLVVSSRSGIDGIRIAREMGVPVEVVERKAYADADKFSEAVWHAVDSHGGFFGIALLGWLPLLRVAPRWENRVVNAHPSLLPAFGGKGMFGGHVHAAVLASGARVTGLTYHFVDNEYDHGPIIHQSAVEVGDGEDAASLGKRVVDAQHETLIPVLEAWIAGALKVQGSRVSGGPPVRWFPAR